MLKLILKILSGFYYLITSVINFLYDNKVIKSHEFFAPVISVGNLTVGGTGKTPHTEYIVNLLKDEFTVTVLSRGYKRETSGYIEADKDSSVAEIGDEPKQMMKKFYLLVLMEIFIYSYNLNYYLMKIPKKKMKLL